jgi:hypothetical protein
MPYSSMLSLTLASISQPQVVLAMSRISIDYVIRLPGILSPVGNTVHVQVLHKLSERGVLACSDPPLGSVSAATFLSYRSQIDPEGP